jgi:DNA modification methylase
VAVRRKDVSLDSEEGRKMALLDNLTTQVNLAWDETELEAVQADVEGFEVADFGFDIADLPQVVMPTDKQGEGEGKPQTEVKEDDFDPDAHYETKVKAGEVWQLGEHRLMCGDSTDADAVAKLMNGERADLVFTDPPYGMNLDTDYSSMQGFGQGGKYDAGHVDDFTPDMVQAVLDLNAKETFIWGADYFAELIPNRNDGSFIVWDKRANDGGTIEQDESSDKMFGSCFELCWSKTKHKRDIARVKWAGMFGMNQTTDAKRVHPTQKPIALVAWFLNRYGKEGDIVADIFGGSGSTMIACEQLGRKCRMMELDPHYCTVIIARWEKLTGQKAIKL